MQLSEIKTDGKYNRMTSHKQSNELSSGPKIQNIGKPVGYILRKILPIYSYAWINIKNTMKKVFCCGLPLNLYNTINYLDLKY